MTLSYIWSLAMTRSSRPVTVTLGALQRKVSARVKSGAYASVSEVMRAALRALDREETALDGVLKSRIEEAFSDKRPSVPAEKVFDRLRKRHTRKSKAHKE
jgi:antitoxin ParD1/3/4